MGLGCRALLFALFVGACEAHGRLSKPQSRDAANGQPEYKQNEPVSGLTSTDFVCRNQPQNPTLLAVEAGKTLDFEWTFSAAHVGDCALYVSYDLTAADADKQWFKISNFLGDQTPPKDCRQGAGQTQTLTLPSWLPNGQAIFRWEWYALHVRAGGRIEYYSQCFDVTVSGGAAASTLANISPKVKIGTHLPAAATAYRDGFSPNCDNDLRLCTKGDGVAVGNNFITGPVVATSTGGGGGGSTPTPTPTTTTASTQKVEICSTVWTNSACSSTSSSSDCFVLAGSNDCTKVNTSVVGLPSNWLQMGNDLNSNPPFDGFGICTTVSSISYKWTCSNPDNKSSSSSGGSSSNFGGGFAAGFFFLFGLVAIGTGGFVWYARDRQTKGAPVALPAWTGLNEPRMFATAPSAPAVPARSKPLL